LMFQRFF